MGVVWSFLSNAGQTVKDSSTSAGVAISSAVSPKSSSDETTPDNAEKAGTMGGGRRKSKKNKKTRSRKSRRAKKCK
jgi:hypothetical protein